MSSQPENQPAPRRRRPDSAYRAARSHSQRVAFLKGAMPAAALVGLVWLGFNFFGGRIVPEGVDVDVGSAVLDDGRLIMANPEVTGRTSDDRPYRLVAQRAIQAVNDPDAIEMEGIDAEFQLGSGENARLLAPEGAYDRQANSLVLRGASRFETDDGTEVRFDGADVDVENGGFVTARPVYIVRDGTTITAGSMRITDDGASIILETDVRVTIPPGSLPVASGTASQENQ